MSTTQCSLIDLREMTLDNTFSLSPLFLVPLSQRDGRRHFNTGAPSDSLSAGTTLAWRQRKSRYLLTKQPAAQVREY